MNAEEKRVKKKGEKGVIVIESMMVLILVLFVLVFLINLGFFFYQRWNVKITANEAAAKVASVYPYIKSELKTGPTDYDQIKDIALYRYTTVWVADEYKDTNVKRGEEYAAKYLSAVTLAYGIDEPELKLKVVEDAWSSKHIEATVTASYQLPFAEGFAIFGFDTNYKFEGKGYAAVSDYGDYLQGINLLANLNYIAHFDDVNATNAINKVYNIVKSVEEMIDKFGDDDKKEKEKEKE